MARISLDPPRTLAFRFGSWLARRRYGTQLDPLAAMAHHPPVARSLALFELQIGRWRTLDRGLKDVAVFAAAAAIGCSWCMDFGYWESTMNHGVPAAKIQAITEWRDSEVFTDLERLVMLYAEAMTVTPPAVTDDLVAELAGHLSTAEMVELTAIIAVENQRSRFNSALGLTAQGFGARCELQNAGR
ncbi:MAG: carboxymuconolactone decarboxylase family protein [Streptosporangiaceae bacterium]